ncbi:hypothetical protein AF335_01365 [Streptomyces eurocidicus]|uniref:Uncharacterized protein n=1 Tax=Streptomyces eurocidicus TaxID=66423 RepID=A0A2N8P241_STREU|nr:hypothetical protein [Streptomyces eurocidicus]MBB5118660.1 hypothetical protein [Streptomyces eurocidicus]MBF6056266.1 hypothetical protein [Streptomyces eurocidicus]PNE35078.1 hypothetical protein AF335_01365 [Streptomyces eurocidicus]
MAKIMNGVGRVTVFPLLHLWPDTYGVVAYAATGQFGDTAIVGYLPIPEVPDVYLMDIAARHAVGSSATASVDRVLCTGWSSRSVPKPGTLDLPEAAWTLEVDGRGIPKETLYGHNHLFTGRFSLDSPDLMEQARKVLDSRASIRQEVPVG